MLYIIITLVMLSCENNNERTLIGIWSVDSIIEDDYEILDQFKANMASFDKDYSCFLPTAMHKPYKKGKWFLDHQDSIMLIHIDVEGNKLSGTYILKFWKDYENKLFKMTLYGDKITVECTKGLYNFDKEKSW